MMALLSFPLTFHPYDLIQENSSTFLADKIPNLLLQIIAFIRVMPVISLEAGIFVLIALIRISFHLLWPLQGWIILDLHKHLIKWNI